MRLGYPGPWDCSGQADRAERRARQVEKERHAARTQSEHFSPSGSGWPKRRLQIRGGGPFPMGLNKVTADSVSFGDNTNFTVSIQRTGGKSAPG
jgi:hypothetical protein